MRKFGQRAVCVLVLVGLAAAAQGANDKSAKAAKKATKDQPAAEETISESKLPEEVRETFLNYFPNAVITKLASAETGGTMVWNISYRDGKSRRETHIAANGTMLGLSVPITKKTAPRQVLLRIEELAKQESAELGDMKRLEVSYETKGGKVVKLDKPATRYSVAMIKGGQTTTIVVDEKGKTIDGSKPEESNVKKRKESAA